LPQFAGRIKKIQRRLWDSLPVVRKHAYTSGVRRVVLALHKQPFCFEVNGGELFAFAGIWDRWKDPSGKLVETCSILTTAPNAVASAVHDRMPVIPDPDSYDLWLDPGMRDVAAASDLLKPCDARLMRCYPVSSRINHVTNDDEGCSAPAGDAIALKSVVT
jgi:putative SOS response-associated peptidase YedK